MNTSLWNSPHAVVAKHNKWFVFTPKSWQTLILGWPHFAESFQHFKHNSRIGNTTNEWPQSFGCRTKSSITSKHQTRIIFMFKIDESFVSHCWLSRIFFKMQNRFNKNEVSPKSMFASFGVCGKIFVLFGHHGMWRISQRRVHFWGILTGYVRGAVVSFWCVRQCHRITM